MASEILTPETRGHDESNIGTGKGTMERELERHYRETDPLKPQMFRMATRLPREGRAAALLGATDRMWLNMKAYAEGGENVLHAHTNEDHSFIIMAGRATFYGPDGEIATLGRNEGILLPRGATYRFHAEEGEPLVILRVGCVVDASRSVWERKGTAGEDVPASSEANKTQPTVFHDDKSFG